MVTEEDRKLEIDWRQRSKQLWLQEIDTRTRFFHLIANSKRRAYQILRIQVENQGLVISSPLPNHFRISQRGDQNRGAI